MEQKKIKTKKMYFPEMRYIYLGLDDYQFGNPVICIGYILNLEKQEIKYSMTICSDKDKFIKSKARIILQHRMIGERFCICNYKYDKVELSKIIENIIEQYNLLFEVENPNLQKRYFKQLGFQRPIFLPNNLNCYLRPTKKEENIKFLD